jgi:TRAP-type uncharacterized transport system substrate-binding protein
MKIIIAALLASISLPALAQTPAESTTVRICTGGMAGNYFFAGKEIAARMGGIFKPVIINTSGSLDNLRRMAKGECDLSFTQGDVSNQFVIENPAQRDAMEIFHIAYTEYTHLLCPVASGWTSITEFGEAKGSRKLIVGPDGSGTAETWRILRAASPEKYDTIQRVPVPADYSSAHAVAINKDMCMLWVSGLNSNDMISTNALSIKTVNGVPSLSLASFDDRAMLKIKGNDGSPLYTVKTVSPIAPMKNVPGMYDNLINNSGWFSSASIKMLAIPANIMIRVDFKKAMDRGMLTRIQTAIDDAQPTIWSRVDPAGHQ